MEIHISNFRSIKEGHFKFSKGLNLLKGDSGSGKTTIFESVKWCLYGGMKNIIPLDAQGKVKIRVSVQIGDRTIVRSNQPEKVELVVGSMTYENDDAKEKIKELFGTRPLWETCSYLSQDERNFLLQSSQKEKTDILKEILFDMSNEDSDWYKDRFERYKNNLRERNCTRKGEIDIMEEDFLNEPTPKELKKALKRKDDLQDLPKLETKYDKITKKIEEYEKFNQFQTEKDKSKEILDEYPFPLTYTVYENWRKYWELRDKMHKFNEEHKPVRHELSREEIRVFQKQHESNMMLMEKFSLTDVREIEPLYEEKLKLLKNAETYHYKLERWKRLEEVNEKLQLAEEKIELAKEKMEKVTSSKLFAKISEEGKFSLQKYTLYLNRLQDMQGCVQKTCPECKAALVIDGDGNLKLPSENPDNVDSTIQQLEKIKKKIDKYEKNMEKVEELQKEKKTFADLDDFTETETDQTDLEKECRLLSTYKEVEISNFEGLLEYCDWNDLCDEFDEIKDDKFEENPIDDKFDLQRYLDAKTSYERSQQFLEEYQIISEEEYKKKVEKRDIIKEEIEKLERVREIIDESEKRNSIKERRLEIGLNNEKISKASLLSEKIETLINQNLEMFLTDFNNLINEAVSEVFEGMSIYLSLFKKNKVSRKTKPNVNIEINYKGNQCDSFSILSGGEKKRLSMVFTLVFCIICDCQFIFLDEFMDSLNEERRSKCLNLFKNLLGDRILVNSCHEAIEGYYGNIVELK